MIYKLLTTLDRLFGVELARAHCDIPCGIYDPISAQIAAVTVVRMIDLMYDLESKKPENHVDFINSMARYIAVKEEHAEKAKQEVRIIWGDYLKAQHLEKFPDAHALVHKIMQLGSKVRQTTDRKAAETWSKPQPITEMFDHQGLPPGVPSPYNSPELAYPAV
jgi:nickel superoxide dismutase